MIGPARQTVFKTAAGRDLPRPSLEAAQDRLLEALERHIPEIRTWLELDYIAKRFEIRFLELGELPPNPTTGKVKRLHDKRVLSDDEN